MKPPQKMLETFTQPKNRTEQSKKNSMFRCEVEKAANKINGTRSNRYKLKRAHTNSITQLKDNQVIFE